MCREHPFDLPGISQLAEGDWPGLKSTMTKLRVTPTESAALVKASTGAIRFGELELDHDAWATVVAGVLGQLSWLLDPMRRD